MKLWHHFDQQNGGNDHRHEDHHQRVGHGFLDLGLEAFALFLVGRDPFQQGVQRAGLFTGIHQIAVQLIEVLRLFAQGRGEAVAGRDFLFDLVHQRTHGRVIEAFADNVERLQQRYAGFHHGRHLAREQGNVLGLDARADVEQRDGFLAHLAGVDALFAQLCLDQRRVLPAQLTGDFRAFAVGAFPGVNADFRCLDRHVQSLVTRLISSRLVMPCMALSRPEVRRSLKPSLRICSSMSSELPSAMINRCKSAVFFTTS
ncbi:hypothetical protein D3C85_757880 [compost metagenome]